LAKEKLNGNKGIRTRIPELIKAITDAANSSILRKYKSDMQVQSNALQAPLRKGDEMFKKHENDFLKNDLLVSFSDNPLRKEYLDGVRARTHIGKSSSQ
jgi:hypothetical protein